MKKRVATVLLVLMSLLSIASIASAKAFHGGLVWSTPITVEAE